MSPGLGLGFGYSEIARALVKREKLLIRKIDAALVATLPLVGYGKVRGRRELTRAVLKAVREWEREVEAAERGRRLREAARMFE